MSDYEKVIAREKKVSRFQGVEALLASYNKGPISEAWPLTDRKAFNSTIIWGKKGLCEKSLRHEVQVT
jgi:hypothetical protein